LVKTLPFSVSINLPALMTVTVDVWALANVAALRNKTANKTPKEIIFRIFPNLTYFLQFAAEELFSKHKAKMRERQTNRLFIGLSNQHSVFSLLKFNLFSVGMMIAGVGNMSAVLEKPVINEFGIARLVLQFSPFIEMNDEQFFEFCQANRDFRIERNSEGEVIIMPPTGWETGNKNAEITMQ